MSYFSFLKLQHGMADIAKHRPDRFRHMLALADNVFRGPSELSKAEREMLIAFVAGVNECEFCLGAHQAVAQAFGVEEGLIEQLLSSHDYTEVVPRLRPIFALAKKLTLRPMTVVSKDVRAITAVGWSEETAHDVICCIALMNMANRMVSGHGVIGSPAAFEKEAELLRPTGGYGVLARRLEDLSQAR